MTAVFGEDERNPETRQKHLPGSRPPSWGCRRKTHQA